jgi:hypothetical protein
MRFGIVEILILGALCCVPLVVLIGIAVGIVFLNKRLSPSSWFRKILAVVTGLIVDLGGTNIVAGMYTAILASGMVAKLAQQNLSSAEIQSKLMSELTTSSIGMSIPVIVFGILLSILGGYVAGKIARQNETVYGLATGIGVLLVSVTLSTAMGLSAKSHSPVWQLALSLAVNIGSTTLGGYLAYLQRKRKEKNLMANNPESPLPLT